MGMIMTEINRPQIGEYHYRRALELADRRGAVLLANLAWNLKNQGKMAEARALYEESMALDPTILQTVLGWARLEEADRNFDAAGRTAGQGRGAGARQPERHAVARRAARPRAGPTSRPWPCSTPSPASARTAVLGPSELLEKGRLLDQMGRYDDAFAAFVEGKRLVREVSGTRYMAEHAAQLAARLKGFFTANRLRITPRGHAARRTRRSRSSSSASRARAPPWSSRP